MRVFHACVCACACVFVFFFLIALLRSIIMVCKLRNACMKNCEIESHTMREREREREGALTRGQKYPEVVM